MPAQYGVSQKSRVCLGIQQVCINTPAGFVQLGWCCLPRYLFSSTAHFGLQIFNMNSSSGKCTSVAEEEAPGQGLEQWLTSTTGHEALSGSASLSDKDEAFDFLQNNPRRAELLAEGQAILDDPIKYKRLLRKIDFTIVPLLALTYFLQALDKTTLEVRPF